VGLGLQASARTDAVQVAIYVELEQIGRQIARTAGILGLDTREPKSSPSTKASMKRTGFSGPT
jgi:hypothetical protein